MSSSRNYSGLKAFVGVLAIFAALAYFHTLGATHSGHRQMTKEATQSPITGLKVTLKQSPTASPPSVLATVTNTNAEPVSILSYDSPLDRAALQLGLLTITPAGANKPMEIAQIQVRRVWPPKRESLVTIAPGESASNNIELKPIIVPAEKLGNKAKVVLRGSWQAVWAKSKDELGEPSLQDPLGSPDASQGDFESNELEISIG